MTVSVCDEERTDFDDYDQTPFNVNSSVCVPAIKCSNRFEVLADEHILDNPPSPVTEENDMAQISKLIGQMESCEMWCSE